MNMFVPVVCYRRRHLSSLLLRAAPRAIPQPALKAIAVILIANWIAFSILGGALLTRYLLPMYPLILLLCVSDLAPSSPPVVALAALSAAAFLAGIWINPPYAFAPEDNLTYRDMIVLHQQAVRFIEQQLSPGHRPHRVARHHRAHPSRARLHAHPIKTVAIQNFAIDQMQKAAADPGAYDTAFIFSTKWEPPAEPDQSRHTTTSPPTRNSSTSTTTSPRRSRSPASRRDRLARPTAKVSGQPYFPSPVSSTRPSLPRSQLDTPLHALYSYLCSRPLQVRSALRKQSSFLLLLLFTLPALPHVVPSRQTEPPEPAVASSLSFPSTTAPASPNLAWIGDSFPDTLDQRFASAGFLTISRDDRQYRARPSRPSRRLQALARHHHPHRPDARCQLRHRRQLRHQRGRIAVQAQVLDVNKLELSQPINDSSELPASSM